MGPEDLPNPFTFLVDAAFYGILLAVAWRVVRPARSREQASARLGNLWPLIPALVILLAGLLSYRAYPGRKSPGSGRPETAILGNWRSTDAASGKGFIFRFYESGRLSIVFPDAVQKEGAWGEYRWAGEKLRITLRGSGAPEAGFCAALVSFLQDDCQTKVVYPASYPYPVEAANTVYPAPTVGPVAFSSVDELFGVEIAGDILTLIQPADPAQTFSRVTGD